MSKWVQCEDQKSAISLTTEQLSPLLNCIPEGGAGVELAQQEQRKVSSLAQLGRVG